MTCLMWFRDDLRLHDNQALRRAAEAASLAGVPLVAVVLDEPAYPGTRPLGGATTWWRRPVGGCPDRPARRARRRPRERLQARRLRPRGEGPGYRVGAGHRETTSGRSCRLSYAAKTGIWRNRGWEGSVFHEV